MTFMTFKNYHANLDRILQGIEVDVDGNQIDLESGIRAAQGAMKNCNDQQGEIFFVGNGGSSAIATHMALDYSKAGKFRANSFDNVAALTAISNDLSYDEVYSYQVKKYAIPSDVLVAISSSGQSKNILNAVDTALEGNMYVVTLSGFKLENPLRKKGNINFYAPAQEYGFVELTHHIILHMMLDTMV